MPFTLTSAFLVIASVLIKDTISIVCPLDYCLVCPKYNCSECEKGFEVAINPDTKLGLCVANEIDFWSLNSPWCVIMIISIIGVLFVCIIFFATLPRKRAVPQINLGSRKEVEGGQGDNRGNNYYNPPSK